MSKYGNRKVIDHSSGREYDSQKEALRAIQLRLMERGGLISDLKEQVKYELIPKQYVDGKLVERAVTYIADFVYLDNRTGRVVVEDTKGFKTKDYIIKRKLLLKVYGLRIQEI